MFISISFEVTMGWALASGIESAWWLESVWWLGWLESAGAVLLATGLVLGCVLLWALNLIGLPGNWLAVALLAVYAVWGPETGRVAIGGGAVAAAFVLAAAGEVVEFLAAALGASRAGASRRSTLYALLGSIVGAVIGAVVGLPVPLVGPILAAVLFGGLGATAGAMVGERRGGRSWREIGAIGRAAFWGRTLGTLGKAVVGLGIILIAVVGLFV